MIQEGDKAVLVGFDDERDGKLVTVLSILVCTAIVDAVDYRANVSIDRLKPLARHSYSHERGDWD